MVEKVGIFNKMGSSENIGASMILTEREHQVLTLVVAGKNNVQIARELVITQYTVKAHLGSIFKKFGVKTRLEAAIFAIKNGIVE